jgi:endonuclease YncB( thermonuclease family)
MFGAGKRRRAPATPALPPPPAGFEVDPLATVQASGARITSGVRSPEHNRRVGGVPNSDHLRGDGLDLTPGPGQSWDDLRSMANELARTKGGKVIDESRTRKPHIHISLPGSGVGLPPPPAGFGPNAPKPKAAPRSAPPAALGFPNGKVADGDTFGLTSGQNARLLGVDAFELNQQARSPSGAMIPLGQNAKGSILPFVGPGATFAPNGTSTYGRPVGTLERDGDAGRTLLRQGNALVAPQFMQGDPRLADYMEAERLARLNQLGAHGNTYQTPESHRKGRPDPWEKAEAGTFGEGQAVFGDEPTPFMGLKLR